MGGKILRIGAVAWLIAQILIGFLQMAGNRIMPVALDSLFLHICKEILRVLHRNHKQMEHRLRVLWMGLHGKKRICDFFQISLPDFPASCCPLRQIFQADAQNRSLQSFQSVIISHNIVIISHLASLILDRRNGVKIFFFPAGNAAALSERIQILTGIKRKAPEFSQTADHFSLIERTVCLGTAASMAAVLFASGDQREILPHGKVMIHDPLIGRTGGSALQLMETSKSLMATREHLASILSEHTGHSLEEIYEKTARDTYFDAEEAVAFGLADRVITQI